MLFIPNKIKVGFQDRKDTYSGRLAYIIYYDNKNKLKKEASWNSWRDQKIDSIDFDNVPTEGFVLNKKVGGYKSDWNFRNAYVRVFDPRGFEFEISVENLLFILENSECLKGKGLSGSFVYSWDGKDLVLLPTESENFKAAHDFTKLQDEKISAKTMTVGKTYLLKKDKTEALFLGKFIEGFSGKKKFYFKNKYGIFSLAGVSSIGRELDIDVKSVSNKVDCFAGLLPKITTLHFLPFINKSTNSYSTFHKSSYLVDYGNKTIYYINAVHDSSSYSFNYKNVVCGMYKYDSKIESFVYTKFIKKYRVNFNILTRNNTLDLYSTKSINLSDNYIRYNDGMIVANYGNKHPFYFDGDMGRDYVKNSDTNESVRQEIKFEDLV